jgi:predicted phage terminase large subunit-like protein
MPPRTIEERRHKALCRLKALLAYDGPDEERWVLSVVAICRTIGYRVTRTHRLVIRHHVRAHLGKMDPPRRSLTLGFRGLGKSTVGTICMAIKLVLVNPNIRILFVSDSEAAAQEFLKETVTHLMTNETLVLLFGEHFSERSRGRLGRIRDGYAASLQRTDLGMREPTMIALGVHSQMASRHFDVVFAEDLVTDANSQTAKQRENLRKWHDSTLLGSIMPHSTLMYIGTRYYPGDLYDELEGGRQEESVGPFHAITLRIPLVENYDDPKDLWRSAEPGRYPLEVCIRIAAEMGRYAFLAQMQQDTRSGEGVIFSYPDFRWYGGGAGADTQLPPLDQLVIWQASDLAAKRTETGDFFAAVTVGVHRADGMVRVFVLDVERGRYGTRKQRDAILGLMRQWRPVQHGIECVAAQAGFAQELAEGTILPVTMIELVGGNRPPDRFKAMVKLHGDKVIRARSVGPLVEQHQVYFPSIGTAEYERVKPLITEMSSFPDADHDDCVDAFVYAVTLAMYGPPAAAGGGTQADDGDDGLLANYDGDDDRDLGYP